jgi:hypothetical protein
VLLISVNRIRINDCLNCDWNLEQEKVRGGEDGEDSCEIILISHEIYNTSVKWLVGTVVSVSAGEGGVVLPLVVEKVTLIRVGGFNVGENDPHGVFVTVWVDLRAVVHVIVTELTITIEVGPDGRSVLGDSLN